MAGRPIIQPATPPLLPAALECLFRDSIEPDLAACEFQALLDVGQLLLDDLLVACEGDCVCGAAFAQRLGGPQAAVWPPVSESPAVAARLAEELSRHLHAAGCRIQQCIAPIPHPPATAALAEAGFRYVTDLIFLTREVRSSELACPPPRMTFEPAARDDLAFAELMNETFVGSQDLPETNGLRSAAEILAGCQVAARVDEPLWWYACFEARRVGVLQLAPTESDSEFELAYMGFVPDARGQGFGLELVRLALGIVAMFGGERLSLSRDCRNNSAARIYDQLNFRETHRRAAWLKIFR